jgi:hypothetical protein
LISAVIIFMATSKKLFFIELPKFQVNNSDNNSKQ